MSKKLLVFGTGYTAQAFLKKAQGLFEEVLYTSRLPSSNPTIYFDGAAPLPSSILKGVTHLLISIPPIAGEDIVLKQHKFFISQNNFEWIGYLSTVGVYGNCHGKWVDETAEINPSSQRTLDRAKVEQEWLDLYHHHVLPVHIFRLAGIYGPNRSAIDSLLDNTAKAINKPGHVFSRIHVEDIAQTLIASIHNPQPGRIYNVSDNEPTSAYETLQYAAYLLGKDCPLAVPYEHAQLNEMLESFYKDCRRICNKRIKNELGIKLLYPTYREGLQAILYQRLRMSP
jgi:nucleoside-diphosphate-sugar epimerase